MVDDAAIALKYIDNIVAGYGYRYNAIDAEPVFGSSSILFTYLAALLKILSPDGGSFLYARLPGLVGFAVTLFVCYASGALIGGHLLGWLSFLYVVAFPHYFIYADSGLETLLAAALMASTFHLFYFQTRPVAVFVLCAAMAFTKLDLLAVSGLLVCAQVFLNFKNSGNRFKDCLVVPAAFYVLPVGAFFVGCQLYFGSLVPQSLTAKLFMDASPDGLNYFRRFFSILQPTSFIMLVSLIPLSLLAAASCLLRRPPSFRFTAVFLAAGVLLVQLWAVPFTNMFLWYMVVPFLAFQMMVVFSVNEFRETVPQGKPFAAALALLPATALTLAGMFTPLFPGLKGFAEYTDMHQSFLATVEAERRHLGRYLRQVGRPDQWLLTGYGWPAYDSGMNVIDVSGINTPWILDGPESSRLAFVTDKAAPDFIVDYKMRKPVLVEKYDVIRVAFGVTRYTRGLYHEWEVYRKRDKPWSFQEVVFLNLDDGIRSSVEEGWGRKIVKASPFDYILLPSSPGVPDTCLEFQDVTFSSSTVGVYCYVTEPGASPVDFVLEAIPKDGEPIVRTLTVAAGQEISLLTLDVPVRIKSGKLRICTRLKEGIKGGARNVAHIRDPFIGRSSQQVR